MSNPTTQPDFTRLRRFRQQAYALFTHSKDAFFDLLDAVWQTPRAGSFVELSLAPAFRRQWSSVYQAIEEARYDEAALNELCLAQVPAEPVAHFAIDVTGMRRLHSPTLQERLYYHGAQRAAGGRGVFIGLPYSVTAWASQRGSSFTPPVHIQRLKPGEQAVAVAVQQVLWLGLETPAGLDWRAGLARRLRQPRILRALAGQSGTSSRAHAQRRCFVSAGDGRGLWRTGPPPDLWRGLSWRCSGDLGAAR